MAYYTIDLSLKIPNVNTNGQFSETSIPIILNRNRCLRLRKGTPSNYKELIHKYSNQTIATVDNFITAEFDCKRPNNSGFRCLWKITISTKKTIWSSDVKNCSTKWKINTPIKLFIKTNNDYGLIDTIFQSDYVIDDEKTLIRGVMDMSGVPSIPSFYIESAGDDEPIQVITSVTMINGDTFSSNNYINLGSSKKVYISNGKNGNNIYTKSSPISISRNIQEY